MNTFEKREKIKLGLSVCTEKQQLFFKRIYSHNDLDKNINEVVDLIDKSKVDWALKQIENTLKKNCIAFPENVVIIPYELKRKIRID